MTTIDNIAAGNVRSAVDMVKNFLSSAHTNTKKILAIEEDSPGTYFIPMHEFMRSLIYGNNKFFDSETSVISNMFSITTQDPKEYFLKLALINELIFLGSSDVAKQGFIETKLIYTHFQSLGYIPEQIEQTIEYCLKEELIENPINSVLRDSDLAANSIRVKTRGAVYVRMIASTFTYIDAMIVDTPFINKALLEAINKSYTQDASIEERKERAIAFMDYLNQIYETSLKSAQDPRINVLVPKLMGQFNSSIGQVNSSLLRTAMKQR